MSSKDSADAFLMVIKKIIKWVIFGFISFIAFIFLFIYSMNYYSEWQNRAKLVTNLSGISLDESLSDVLFKNDNFKKIPFQNSQLIVYGNERLSVVFEQGKVQEINYQCGDNVFLNDGLNQISCGYSSESIKEKYGSNIEIYCLPENSRVYFSPKYNAIYYLKSNKVTQITLTSTKQKSSSWLDCGKIKIN